ncbi:MAG: hypothetical protein ABI380_13455 [Edaphobacter sp.]
MMGNTTELKTRSVTRIRYWPWVLSAFVVVALVAASFQFSRFRRSTLTERDTVILADFVNSTGDPVFDEVLRQGFAMQLAQSPFFSFVSEDRIQETLQMMGRPADSPLTPAVAQEICIRTGSAAVLDGHITKLGNHYVLGLRATNCKTRDMLAERQVEVTGKEEVLNALSRISSAFRSDLGESLTTIDKLNVPLAEATTSSLAALQAYSAGVKTLSFTSEAAALPFFKRAIEIDPQFATAYAESGLVYGAIGESTLSAEYTSKAYELRNRASDAERFLIIASYESRVTGNFQKAEQVCETWVATYPREGIPHAYLAGFILVASARYEQAVVEALKTIKLNPHLAIGYAMLGSAYSSLDRYDEDEKALQLGSDRGLDNPEFARQRYELVFLHNDSAAMGREVTLSRGKPEEDWIADHEAFTQAYFGHLGLARVNSRRAIALAAQSSEKERMALFEAGAAIREGLFGNRAAARTAALAAVEDSKGREVEFGAAFALALAGEISKAQELTDDLKKRFPEDTSVEFNYLPSLDGLISIAHGQPLESIELLQTAVPYELGMQRSTIHGIYGPLYPIYVRGEAYLAAREGANAVTEFQKIIDHRGIVVSDPIGALAHLELGRAYTLSGDSVRARAAYRSFFELWKSADPDIPLMNRAKADYERIPEPKTN